MRMRWLDASNMRVLTIIQKEEEEECLNSNGILLLLFCVLVKYQLRLIKSREFIKTEFKSRLNIRLVYTMILYDTLVLL